MIEMLASKHDCSTPETPAKILFDTNFQDLPAEVLPWWIWSSAWEHIQAFGFENYCSSPRIIFHFF